jgi:hypothetical protein
MENGREISVRTEDANPRRDNDTKKIEREINKHSKSPVVIKKTKKTGRNRGKKTKERTQEVSSRTKEKRTPSRICGNKTQSFHDTKISTKRTSVPVPDVFSFTLHTANIKQKQNRPS